MKEIILKVNEKKSISNNPLQFYIRNLFKMNNIKKINALQFYKRNPFKTEQTRKIKNREFLALLWFGSTSIKYKSKI